VNDVGEKTFLLPTCADNVFTSVETFEFQDSTDTTWTSNDIGGGCLDGSTDFAKGSIPDC